MLILWGMENVITSSRFVSVSATGETWRDISKTILEGLESVKTDGFNPNVGLVYMTQELVQDASSIMTLLKSVAGISHWAGTTAIGICANGTEYWGVPAIVVLVGEIAPESVHHFHAREDEAKRLGSELKPWLNNHDPMLTILHGHGVPQSSLIGMIEDVDTMVGGFMVGGFTSFKSSGALLGTAETSTGICGFVFDEGVAVSTALSQGCVPMGASHEVTMSDDHIIASLDGQKPFDVFSQDMKAIVEKRLGYKAPETMMETGVVGTDFHQILEGSAHIAIPVMGSDQKDFMVRNIVGMDPETGEIAVAESLEDKQNIIFVHRDSETVRMDLSSTLVALRERVIKERGDFKPLAALYVSCVGRLGLDFKGDGAQGGEMALVRDILGDVPLAGFYAAGEISAGRIYGYTGVLTLFL